MSLQFIYQFQARVYELFCASRDIRSLVTGIYLLVQHDAKHPFILISILKVNDISKYEMAIYEIDFEISIFARDKSLESLLKIVSNIASVLKPGVFDGQGYKVASIKHLGLEFVRGHDLLTTKIVMNYKALIQGALEE